MIAKIQDADYKVTGLKLHHLTPTEAEQFFIAYKGVWNDYLVILNLNNLFSIVVRCTKLRFLFRLTLNNSPRDPSSPYALMLMSIVSETLLVHLTRYYQTFIVDTIVNIYFISCLYIKQEIARKLKPSSIRARFGHDTALNAIHCTDLPTDGTREVLQILVIKWHGTNSDF